MRNLVWVILLVAAAVWGVMSDVAPPTKMIVLAIWTFAVVKWQAWQSSRQKGNSIARTETLAWFFLTPTLNADQFFRAHLPAAECPSLRSWLAGIAKAVIGATLIAAVAPHYVSSAPLLAGWITMTGLVMVLHFGLLDLIVLFWRSQGRDIQPLMKRPLGATSLSDFWGRRWNTAFRDFAHEQVFRPLCHRWSAQMAIWSAFVFSALIHEMAISVPAGGGYGLPTVYFLLQSAGMNIERRATRTRGWLQTTTSRWL